MMGGDATATISTMMAPSARTFFPSTDSDFTSVRWRRLVLKGQG
jgi:hypothetical protein